MKLENAIKKLEKVGMKVNYNGEQYFARAENGRREIRFRANRGGSTSLTCIQVRGFDQMDDSQSDYFAGTWCDNLSQAIRLTH